MVMSAGQRTYLISRNDDANNEFRNANENFDNESFHELETDNDDDDETQRDYKGDDYRDFPQASDKPKQTSTTHRSRIRSRTKNKNKRYKSKAQATQSSIGPKLKNLSLGDNTMASQS